MKKIKIIDVANHAGVSKSTISQYLSGRFNYMSPQTKARIEEAIKALNYIPNPIARSLKTDKTSTIGVIVRDIAGYDTSRVIRGIDDYCKNNNYNVVIYNTDFDEKNEAQALLSLQSLRVDGIIIASSGKNHEMINKLVNEHYPLVQFQLEYDQCPSNIVLSDYQQAAFQATEHLIKLGHRRIAFITQEFEGIRSRHERYLGYQKALQQYDIALIPSLIQYWSRATGLQTPLAELLNIHQPTAIFSQHLAITVDIIKALEQLKLSLPDDISLLGFDDIPMVEHFKVPITVIKQDPYQVGHQSATLLLKHINDNNAAMTKITVPCQLVKRQSCQLIKQKHQPKE